MSAWQQYEPLSVEAYVLCDFDRVEAKKNPAEKPAGGMFIQTIRSLAAVASLINENEPFGLLSPLILMSLVMTLGITEGSNKC